METPNGDFMMVPKPGTHVELAGWSDKNKGVNSGTKNLLVMSTRPVWSERVVFNRMTAIYQRKDHFEIKDKVLKTN